MQDDVRRRHDGERSGIASAVALAVGKGDAVFALLRELGRWQNKSLVGLAGESAAVEKPLVTQAGGAFDAGLEDDAVAGADELALGMGLLRGEVGGGGLARGIDGADAVEVNGCGVQAVVDE